LRVNSCIRNNPETSSLHFSLATADDLDELVAIENQAFPLPWPCQHFIAELAKDYSRTLLAIRRNRQEREICGYIIFWLIFDEMHILNLAVKTGYRRQGIARALIHRAMQTASCNQVRIVWLEVRPSNQAALSLYHSLGFRCVARRKKYYSETGEDALIMSRALP